MTVSTDTVKFDKFEGLYFLTTTSGQLVYVNRSLRQLLVSPMAKAASGADCTDFMLSMLEPKLCYAISRSVSLTRPLFHDAPLATTNDEVVPVQWLTRLVQNATDKSPYLESIGIAPQPTKRCAPRFSRTFSKTTRSQFSFANALEQSADHVTVMNTEGRIEQVNTAFEVITGYERSRLIGRYIREVWSDMLGPETERTVFRILQRDRSYRGVHVNRSASGDLFFNEVVVSPLHNDQGNVVGCIAVGRDTTNRHLTDPLTGLQNRRMLVERIGLALARSHRETKRTWALLFIDVDRFKAVNATYGKEIGDQVILELSRRIQGAVREIDAIAQVGHLNRDEFAVLLESLRQPSDASVVTERIQYCIRQPIRVGNIEVVVTASVGIALGTFPYQSAEDVIRDAETAMVHAKRDQGSNCHFFDPKLQKAIVDNLALTGELRRALSNREFVLHYQPIVSVENWGIVGFEALIRWRHPEKGLISPTDFIPLAEEIGLIVPLGSWVLRTACAQLYAWQCQGLSSLHLSVNVSTRQFREPNFEDLLASIVAQTQVNSNRLKLEVTETTAVDDPQRFVAILTRLKQQGIEILLDDFGTGYSSLSALTQFPLDRLKIDRSFVRNVPQSSHDCVVVNTIVAMAKSLGLGLIAEGVETLEQLEFLRGLGCEQVQGYLFSPAVSVAQASQMLADQAMFGERSWSPLLRSAQ